MRRQMSSPFAMHLDLGMAGAGDDQSELRIPFRCGLLMGESTRIRGPSQAACRENSKPQWGAIMRMERAEKAAPSAWNGNVGCIDADGDEVDAQARAFREGARAVDQLIEGISRSVRMDHLDHSEDRRLSEQEDELRRQQESELRRARRKEREARDPHRKVALKLENRRRFERQLGQPETQESIPTRKVDFISFKGTERVAMVDVGQIRARCKQLSGGATVRSLLDHQRQKEQRERINTQSSRAAFWGSLNSASNGSSFMGTSMSAPMLLATASSDRSPGVAGRGDSEAALWQEARIPSAGRRINLAAAS